MSLQVPDIGWAPLWPPLLLLITASVGLLFALFRPGGRSVALLSLLGLAGALVVNLILFQQGRSGEVATGFGLRYLADLPATGFNFVILLGTALAILLSYDYLERTGLDHPEYYPLMLFAATGAMVMAAAGDFIVLLLGLEIMSLAVYVLSAWRHSRQSEEAGMKYFLLGAFASAIFIYGIALLYGATGAFHYAGIASSLTGLAGAAPGQPRGVLILGGLAFKAALAPFHQWAPDVYTGAPTPVTAFMSVVVKAAAFAALLRVAVLFFPVSSLVSLALAVLVALTMVIGNFAGAAAGGEADARLLRGGPRGLPRPGGAGCWHCRHPGGALVSRRLRAYHIGAFAVLVLLGDRDDRGDDLGRLAGLGRQRPGLALAMTVFLLSLAGIPPLAGFMGKVLVFQAAIEAGYLWLAILGIVTSVAAVAYYFRVITYMYFREPEHSPPEFRSRATGLAIGLAALGTILFGIFPGWWLQLITTGSS